MKIALSQTKPVKGDIETNVAHHCRLIDLAAASGAGLVLFPELSLTGYEPALAAALALAPGDSRLAPLQTLSDTHGLTIGAGAPLRTGEGLSIAHLFFHPQQKVQVYSKQYLHPDEEAFFIQGENETCLLHHPCVIAPAICYELSVPAHADKAHRSGAGIYLAAVAKPATGVAKAAERLWQVAKDYSMVVAMVNCLGENDGMTCAGGSSVWDRQGRLKGQMDDSREGVLLFDITTATAVEIYR